MTIAALEYMKNLMQSMGIPYEFMRWNIEPPECYFVGEYLESPSTVREESGKQDSTFILRGFTRGSWLQLEQYKATIEKNCARTAILADGSGIAVFYDSSTIVPTMDNELKSIKINLSIQEWRVR